MNYANIDELFKYIKLAVDDQDATLTMTDLESYINSFKLSKPKVDKRSIYTSRDIQDIRNYLVNTVEELTDEWTDFNESDAGMVLIELMSGLADMLGFYLDKQTLECYIGTVKQRKNGANILKLIDYRLFMTNSSITTLKFSLNAPAEYDVIIPKYTQVAAVRDSSTAPVYYATKDDAYIPAGELSTEVVGIQGEVTRSSITSADLRKNKRITLLSKSVAHNSIMISSDTTKFKEVNDAVYHEKGPYFSVSEDKDLNAVIRFANNYEDYLPSESNAKIDIVYLTSLGDKGNVRKGAINAVVSDEIYYSKNGEVISKSPEIKVTNLTNSSGGSPRETLDEARVNAPNKLAMLGKAITLRDYQDMASGLPSVYKCKAVDWTTELGKYVQAPYIVHLYVIPKSGEVANPELLESIKQYFVNQDNRRCPSSMQVKVMTPDYVKMNIDVTIYTQSVQANYNKITKAVTEALHNTLSYKRLEFGKSISPSNLINIIEDSTPLIDSIELHTPTITPKLSSIQFLQLGELNITIKDVEDKYSDPTHLI